MSDRAIHLLVVGDGALADEVESALPAARRGRAFVRLAEGFDEAERGLRQRSVDVVVAEVGHDPAALRAFVERVRALAPDALVLGVQAGPGHASTPSDVLVEAVRSRLVDVLERPLSSEALRDALVTLESQARTSAAEQGAVLAFHSTKGGVGKSTLSINTAAGLALRHPDQVLLVDCSLQLGVCASALDLEPESSIATVARDRDRVDARMLRELSTYHEGTGLRLLSAPLDPVDASDVDDHALAQVITLARSAFEFIVIDTLPIVDAVMLAIFDLADRIYLVNQGTVPDVIGAARLRELLDRLGIPPARERIVLNRNTPSFPGQLGRDEVADRIGRDVDFEVPYDKRVLSALNLGQPRILSAGRWSGWGRVLRTIVDDAESIAADRERRVGTATAAAMAAEAPSDAMDPGLERGGEDPEDATERPRELGLVRGGAR